MRTVLRNSLLILGLLATQLLATSLLAQSPVNNPVPGMAPSLPSAALGDQQSQLGQRFSRFETLLLRLADVESVENPERAALLRRASRQAREAFILDRINQAAGALNESRFAQAIKDQKWAQDSLTNLLQLLQSEDRQLRIRLEKERMRQLINDLKRLERSQRSARSQTESGNELKQAESLQKEIDEKSSALEQRLDAELKDEQGPNPSSDQKSKEPSEQTPTEQAPNEPGNDGNPSDDKKPDSDNKKPNEDQKLEDQKAADQKPDDEKPGDKKPSDEKPDDKNPGDKNPGDKNPGNDSQDSPKSENKSQEQKAADQLQKARQAMQQAMKSMQQAERKPAVEAQREAEERLREAAEELERILKQLREEEIERQLAKLESRLREIAARQTKVLESTRSLAATVPEQRDRQTDVESSKLSFEEKKIAADTDRALLLLEEDGTGRAFPEVLGEVRDDMIRVAGRLNQTQIDVVTQGLQEDILAALQEMIESLQKEQRKREEEKQKQQEMQMQQSQPGDDPLVDSIAELRLIKTQELRIKKSTERYSKVADSSTPDADLLQLLNELSERQIRLYRVVRDILKEK